MVYNSSTYNTFAYNIAGVFESGTLTATATPTSTESTIAVETGQTTALSGLNLIFSDPYQTAYNANGYNAKGGEIAVANDSGAIPSSGSLTIISGNGYNNVGYNNSGYNALDGETALAFEDGEIKSNSGFDFIDTTRATESGTTIGVARFDVLEDSLATESGTLTALAEISILRSAGYQTTYNADGYNGKTGELVTPPIFRVHTRTLDLSFTVERVFEFNENKTMTEIKAIDDTISDETRRLKFTAEDESGVKDIEEADIEWSLADKNDVLLDTTDLEVTVDEVNLQEGRFDIIVDTFDVPPGVYRQRLKVVDGSGRVTRSNGTYRIREF